MATTMITATFDELEAAYHAAKAALRASGSPDSTRWGNALDWGYDLLLQSDGISADVQGGRVVTANIPSSNGGSYEVNGHCECQAAQHGKPCKHRAAKRLLERVVQARNSPPTVKVETLRERAQREADELFA